MDGIKGRLAKGAAWITAARLITNLLGLVSTLVLARLLTPGDFGIVALGWTVLAILNSVTEISIGAVLIHHPNPTREDRHRRMTSAKGMTNDFAVTVSFFLSPESETRFVCR